MWVVFLLGMLTVAICALVLVYIGNKVFIAMEKDLRKNKRRNVK